MSSGVDEALAARGYTLLEPTQVMHLDLSAPDTVQTRNAIDTLEVSAWV
jgi:hypothetical protein